MKHLNRFEGDKISDEHWSIRLREDMEKYRENSDKLLKQKESFTYKVEAVPRTSAVWVEAPEFNFACLQIGIVDIKVTNPGKVGLTLHLHNVTLSDETIMISASIEITLTTGRKIIIDNINPDMAPLLLHNLREAWKGERRK